MDQIEKMPVSDFMYGDFHAEQESEIHFFLSLVLSSLPGVLWYAYILLILLNEKKSTFFICGPILMYDSSFCRF